MRRPAFIAIGVIDLGLALLSMATGTWLAAILFLIGSIMFLWQGGFFSPDAEEL